MYNRADVMPGLNADGASWIHALRPTRKYARFLILVLGDQPDSRSAAFDGFDPSADVVWMAEVGEEATYVWSHKARIAIFLAAMRHFRDALRDKGAAVDYHVLDDARWCAHMRKVVHNK